MILSGNEIIKQVNAGRITISPFIQELVNPNSYNYRLGTRLIEITDSIIDPRKVSEYRVVDFTDEGYILQPGKLYLGSTLEKFGSKDFVTSLIGRSSVGRLGLFLQITADLGQLGAVHHWTLELTVVQPLRIYPGMRIGQISFWSVKGGTGMQYEGKYGTHNDPHHSMIHEEFSSLKGRAHQ